MQLTCGCHHDNGALEIIIVRNIKTVVFVTNKCPSSYLIPGYVHYVSIHGAHCQNGHNDSHYYDEHIEASVGRLKTGSTEKPAAAVAVASKAQQRQRCVQQWIDPNDGDDHSGSAGIEDSCIAKSEADLRELVNGGPGEWMDWGQLEQQEKKGAALAQRTRAGVSLWPEQAVMGSERYGGEAECQITQAETERQGPCLRLQAPVRQQQEKQYSVPTHGAQTGTNHQSCVCHLYPLHPVKLEVTPSFYIHIDVWRRAFTTTNLYHLHLVCSTTNPNHCVRLLQRVMFYDQVIPHCV